MNSITEKEKKLNQTLEKLKNLDLAKKDNSPELENLKEQKNQLEIEYKQLLENYNFFIESIRKEKPDTIKGEFIKGTYLTSTMGISYKVGGK